MGGNALLCVALGVALLSVSTHEGLREVMWIMRA